MSGLLNEIIDESQTAYVKGRAVADGLRSIMFLKDHCVEEKVDALLVSLDAKKLIYDRMNTFSYHLKLVN